MAFTPHFAARRRFASKPVPPLPVTRLPDAEPAAESGWKWFVLDAAGNKISYGFGVCDTSEFAEGVARMTAKYRGTPAVQFVPKA